MPARQSPALKALAGGENRKRKSVEKVENGNWYGKQKVEIGERRQIKNYFLFSNFCTILRFPSTLFGIGNF